MAGGELEDPECPSKPNHSVIPTFISLGCLASALSLETFNKTAGILLLNISHSSASTELSSQPTEDTEICPISSTKKPHKSQIPVLARNGILSSGRADPAINFGKGDWKCSSPVGSHFPFSSQTIFQGIYFYNLNNDIKNDIKKGNLARLQIGPPEGQ